MKPILFWDFNGTILDDVHLTWQIETKMLQERHMRTYTLEEYKDMFCFPVINYYYRMGYTFENETYDDVSVEFNDAYARGFSSCRLMPGFLTKIQEAIQKGYENIILSASQKDNLKQQCRELGIDQYFSYLLGTDNLYGGSKIDMAKAFMQKQKIDPTNCRFIGDTLHDQECANAIGINDVVLVAQGHQSRSVLESGCDHVVDSLMEVEL